MNIWKEEWNVTEMEIYKNVKERLCVTTAPGLDGITNKTWKKVPDCMVQVLARIFTECLKKGEFLRLWKRAALVLIPKGTGFTDGPKKGSADLFNRCDRQILRAYHSGTLECLDGGKAEE